MEGLRALSATLTDIDVVATKIIQRSVKIMNQLHDTDSEFVDELLDDVEDMKLTREDALKRLQEFSLTYTIDAERVKHELGKFVKEGPPEDENKLTGSYTVNAEGCPFLAEVWNGDMYDKTGIDALKDLLADLKNQLKSISSKHLVDNVAKAARKVGKS